MTVCVKITVEEVALGHIILPVLRFYLVSIAEPVLHTRISLVYSRCYLLLEVQSGTLFCLLVAVLIEKSHPCSLCSSVLGI